MVKEPGTSVTTKVLAIVAVFEGTPHAQSLSQISERSGLALSTTHRLVAELTAWGALERDPSGRYRIGLRLWEVSQNAGRQLRESARPHLQDLFSFTQETAHLAVREGREALYIDRVYSTKRVPRASRVGGRLPLHATAVGKVLLAGEDEWLRRAYLEQPLEAPTPRTHINPARLLEELETIRELGYATTLEEVRPGSCSIAVPVLGRTGRVEAALGLVMLSSQSTTMTRHLPTLRGVAARISDAVFRVGG